MEPVTASTQRVVPIAPVGVVLAAGEGRRMGMPKALVRDPDGTSWLRRAVETLSDAGCAPVVVVLGAQADEARTRNGLEGNLCRCTGYHNIIKAVQQAAGGAK